METNINYTIVGAFVISLLAAIILAIIWLSSGFSFEQYVTYQVYMKESVAGLNIDSPVEYNGVAVGAVKSVELNNRNPQLVELLLSIKKSAPITRGTTATLTTRGITGITYIALKDNGNDLRPLVALKGQKYPVIKTAPSLFLRLDTALGQLSANFQKISQAFQGLLDKENLESIKSTLLSIKQITGTIAANSQHINLILENTSKASRQLTPLLQSSSGAMRVIETQTLPAAYRAINTLDDVANTMAEVSAELKQNPSMLIRGVDRQTLGPGETK